MTVRLVIVIGPSGVQFIMVIELSGVQFGLKSYESSERVARVRFEITSMISDKNCTTRSSIASLLDHFEIAQFNSQIYQTMAFFFHLPAM